MMMAAEVSVDEVRVWNSDCIQVVKNLNRLLREMVEMSSDA